MRRLLHQCAGDGANHQTAGEHACDLVAALRLNAASKDGRELKEHAHLRQRHNGIIGARQKHQRAGRHIGERTRGDDTIGRRDAHEGKVGGKSRLLVRTIENPAGKRLEQIGLVGRRHHAKHGRRFLNERYLDGGLGKHAHGRAGDHEPLHGTLQAVGAAREDQHHVGIGLGNDTVLPQAINTHDARSRLRHKGIAHRLDQKARRSRIKVNRDTHRCIGILLNRRAHLKSAGQLIYGNLHGKPLQRLRGARTMPPYGLYDTHRQQLNHHRRGTKTNKRQRNTGNRHHANAHANVLEGLERPHADDPHAR